MHSYVIRYIESTFRRSFMNSFLTRLNSNSIQVHTDNPALSKPLSQLMNHKENTAKNEYFLINKKADVTDTSRQVRNIIRTNKLKRIGDKGNEEKEEEAAADDVHGDDAIHEKKKENEEPSYEDKEDDNYNESEYDEEDDEEVVEKSNTHTRCYFTSNDLLIFRKGAKKIIEGSMPLTKELLLEVFRKKELQPLWKKFGFKSLKIKARTERTRYMNAKYKC